MNRRKFLTTGSQAAAIPLTGGLFAKSTMDFKLNNKTDEITLELPDNFHRNLFYKPVNAWAADFIPLYAKGEFQLFFLLDWRNREEFGEGVPWYRISTKDFVNFTDHGVMIKRGTKKDQDLYIFTGSAIEAEGRYHIFYTGHNPHPHGGGKPVEGVMHAVSDDLQNWEKTEEPPFYAPMDKYEPNDWRDPFVFWNEEDKEYSMLLAARFKKGTPSGRRGLTALSTSRDLVHWEAKEPFYAPGLYYTHECPDLFKMGDWWYLVFSEFSELVRTRYRMSRSLKGPWLTPKRDDFDGHAFYAAKTASDGDKRFIFGWNPTRSNQSDSGNWNWGGNLMVHEIYQQPDGELSVRVPESVSGAFNRPLSYGLVTHTDKGSYSENDDTIQMNAIGTFSGALAEGDMPKRCKIISTISFDEDTKTCGIMLRASEDFGRAYFIRLDPQSQRLVFGMYPRVHTEVPFMLELERDVKLKAETPNRLEILVDGTVGVAYLNNEVAMDFRLYNFRDGKWGIFVEEGSASFKDLKLSTLSKDPIIITEEV